MWKLIFFRLIKLLLFGDSVCVGYMLYPLILNNVFGWEEPYKQFYPVYIWIFLGVSGL